MTIFQKMLITPLLGLTLYTGFILYGLAEYKQSNEKFEEISEMHLFLQELTGANIYLFNQVAVRLKDAVLAGEPDWVRNTNVVKDEINNNFDQLAQSPEIVGKEGLAQLKSNFNHYYSNAFTLSLSLLENDKDFSTQEQLVQNVEHYSKITTLQLLDLKGDIKQRFNLAIDGSKNTLQQLLLLGGFIAVSLLLLMTMTIVTISLSTKKNFQQIIDRMKALADGEPDFSQRLERSNRDELGYLVHWFNKLSDKLEQDHSKVEELAVTDKLTQLANRAHADDYLRQKLLGARKSDLELVGIIIDIDHFKSVNDTHGHLVGDRVLQQFAEILKENTRAADLVARWGGEEFVIIMSNIGIKQATKNAERLRTMIEAYDFHEVGQVTASFGLTAGVENDTPESMIKRSDDSLYRAKQLGRNQVVVGV